MKLSLGAIQYYWPKNTVYDFYESMQDLDIDIVYLGETVCAKRRSIKLQDWLTIAKMLNDSGKEVVLSTLTLIEAASELSTVRKICSQQDFLVEANDMSAVQILSEQGLPFVAGPFINIYNARSLDLLHKLGLKRWVIPVELAQQGLSEIVAESVAVNKNDSNTPLEIELFSYGKLPLAYSARCFTARSRDLAKDNCQFVCMDYPDGLDIISQDQKTVFSVNGIQTQSGYTCDLSRETPSIIETGVDIMRISPQLSGTDTVIKKFRAALDNRFDENNNDQHYCNGYWHNKAGLVNCR